MHSTIKSPVSVMLLVAFAALQPPAIVPARGGQSPNFQVTQVKIIGGNQQTTRIQTDWNFAGQNANQFRIELTVGYSDGTQLGPHTRTASSLARSDSTQVPTHPRGNARATLKSFQVKVSLAPAGSTAIITTRTFTAEGETEVTALAMPSFGQPPSVAITEGRWLRGCSRASDCVAVKWAVAASPQCRLDGFEVGAEAAYRCGETPLASALLKPTRTLSGARSVTGTERQTTLLLSGSARGCEPPRTIKVTLTTRFTLPTLSAEKSGQF